MRRFLAICTFVAASFVPAATAAIGAGPDLLTPDERDWLAAHPTIVLGAGEDWAPWIVRDAAGRVSGFAADHHGGLIVSG
jgi:hypothetical protein